MKAALEYVGGLMVLAWFLGVLILWPLLVSGIWHR